MTGSAARAYRPKNCASAAASLGRARITRKWHCPARVSSTGVIPLPSRSSISESSPCPAASSDSPGRSRTRWAARSTGQPAAEYLGKTIGCRHAEEVGDLRRLVGDQQGGGVPCPGESDGEVRRNDVGAESRAR